MKAFVCREFGPVNSHKVEEIEDPRAEPGMVIICLVYTSDAADDMQ